MSLPISKFCNVVWAWCLSRIHSEQDLEQWKHAMQDPPQGVEPRGFDSEDSGFLEFMAATKE